MDFEDYSSEEDKLDLSSCPSLLTSVTQLNAVAASEDSIFPYGFPCGLGVHLEEPQPEPVRRRRWFNCWRRPKTIVREPIVKLVSG